MKKVIIFIIIFLIIASQTVLVNGAPEPSTVEALNYSKAPTIDGVISQEEWGEPTIKDIVHGNPLNAVKASTIETITFSLWVRWDSDNLYLAIQTPDTNNVNTNTNEMMWNGDAVQLEIDPLGNWKSQGESDYFFTSDKSKELVFSYNSNENRTQSWCFTDGDVVSGNSGVLNKDGLTTYEISIPWTFWGTTPKSGDSIGLTVALLSCEEYSYNGWIEWGSGCIMEERTADNSSGTNEVVLSETKIDPSEVYPTAEPTPVPTNTPKPSDEPGTDDSDKGSFNMLPVIIAACAIVVIAIVAVVLIRIKKKA